MISAPGCCVAQSGCTAVCAWRTLCNSIVWPLTLFLTLDLLRAHVP